MTHRRITEIRPAQPSRDGAGVAIQRVAGMQHAGMDPLLMVDELRSEHREDFAAGFPPHPHRGMQTLTYMKHGGIIHEDSQGQVAAIEAIVAGMISDGAGSGISVPRSERRSAAHLNAPEQHRGAADREPEHEQGEAGRKKGLASAATERVFEDAPELPEAEPEGGGPLVVGGRVRHRAKRRQKANTPAARNPPAPPRNSRRAGASRLPRPPPEWPSHWAPGSGSRSRPCR